MRLARTPLLFTALWLAAATSTAAGLPGFEASAAMDGDEPRLHAQLLVDRDDHQNRGRVGLLLELDPGWHLYWRNPGDSGLAPVLRFSFDGGEVDVGEIAWPAPRAFNEDVDIVTFGYEGHVLLAAPLRWKASSGAPRSVHLTAKVLVCAELCIPASLELERPFSMNPDDRERVSARFERAARRVPPAARERGVQVSLTWPEGKIAPGDPFSAALAVEACAGASDCGLRAPESASASFFPYAPAAVALRAVAIDGGGASFRIELAGEALEPIGEDALLRGVLALREKDGEVRSFEVALPLVASSAAPVKAEAGGVSLAALLRAIALGMLGGLLLNLMPCVLPVLAIKVFAVAELAQRGRRELAGHAAAYTAGILATLLSLALCVVALRWSGTAVGWGFHFQEPVFVAVVAAVLVTFAMNLMGAFEFEVAAAGLSELGTRAVGFRRSFFDGLLAVVLATPCSAPFLGTAIGFAFASGAPVIIAIFLSIGLGLALPFVAVAIVPGWSRWMPRPGPWMLELRRGLGFALLATVAWLLWIVGRSGGVDAMAGLLVLLLAIAFAAWSFGLIQRARYAHVSLLLAAIITLLVTGLHQLEFEPLPAEALAPSSAQNAPTPYTRAGLREVLALGRPAFVYFTADWCLTCKLNERSVLAHPRAQEALAEADFAVLRADWTRRDESIRRELAALGKAGVPVYALYEPGSPDRPHLLPELLRLEPFLNAVAETAEETRKAAARSM